jgi:hypothetical protein
MATIFIMSESCDAMVKWGLKTFSLNMKVKIQVFTLATSHLQLSELA